MTEWTSISVTEEQKQTLKERKPDSASMGAWLVDHIETNNDDLEVEVSVTDIDALQERLDRIESAQANTVSDSIDIAEDGIKDVLNRIDDLQTHLDSRFDEVTRP